MKPRYWCRLLVALGAILAALPSQADAQQLPRPAAKAPRARAAAVARALHGMDAVRGRLAAPRVLRAPTATGNETEPNDSLSIADSVSLGDTISGAADPSGDVDWFGFEVSADTTIVLDVNASRSGSALDPVLYLIGPSSDTTGYTVLAYSDDYGGTFDSHIQYYVTPGRYYAVLLDYNGDGGAAYFYSLSLASVSAGPGDPTTVYASGLGETYGVAAGSTGELYVTDVSSSLRLLRVNPGGVVSPVASFSGVYPLHVVVDGLGNALATVEDTALQFGAVQRITPTGVVSPFASGFPFVAGITVAPDGDVWVLALGNAPTLYRLDPLGARKDSIDVSGTNAHYFAASLAFSPTGALHFSNGYDAVYKLVGRTPQLVIAGEPYIESLAFDRDGYLYLSNGEGSISLYNPSYAPVNAGFALSHLSSGFVITLAFGRDATGVMTSRLFATNSPLGQVLEMNPAGMRAPGFRVGVDLLAITPGTLPAGTMGADYSVALAVQSAPGAPTWSIASGTTPGGLTLGTSTGLLSGVPDTSGTFTFTVRADAGGRQGFQRFTLTVNEPDVSVTAAANHLLAGEQMDAALQRFLDLQGNHNGRYDVGDFRAYLRAQGQLPATQSARKGAP